MLAKIYRYNLKNAVDLKTRTYKYNYKNALNYKTTISMENENGQHIYLYTNKKPNIRKKKVHKILILDNIITFGLNFLWTNYIIFSQKLTSKS